MRNNKNCLTLFPLNLITFYSLYSLKQSFDDSAISLMTTFDAFGLGFFILSIHNYHSQSGHLNAYKTWLHHPKVIYHVFYLYNKQNTGLTFQIYDCIILKIYLCNKQNKTPGQPSKIQNGGPMYLLLFWHQNLSFRHYFYKQCCNPWYISNKWSIYKRFVRFSWINIT